MTELKTRNFIKGMFQSYYEKHFPLEKLPPEIEKREFGFTPFEGGMLRHKSFINGENLRKFLCELVPSNAYYSCAYYENPEASMEDKGWLGADLIFDIDADHIPTPCNKIHDNWMCVNCGFKGKGQTPEKCPQCGSQKFEDKTWPCEIRLETAKQETIKLIEMLTNDFGFSEKELKIYFSGHRGYHIHVESKTIRELDSVARKEIVDYIIGLGLDPKFHGLKTAGKTRVVNGPELHHPGWAGRIAKGVYELLLNASRNDLKKLGLRGNIIKTIIRQREVFIESWKDKTPWKLKGIGAESWMKIAQAGAKLQASKIDTVVTTDIHRLIRLNNSLHGKTALKKMQIPLSKIEAFEPLKEAVVFKNGTLTIQVSEAPEITIDNQVFGPFNNKKVELPMAAAMFLLCKGVAEVI